MTILFVDPQYRNEARRALHKERRREEILGGLSALGGLLGLGLKRQGNLDQQEFMSRLLPTYTDAAASGDPIRIREWMRAIGKMGEEHQEGFFNPLTRLVGLGERPKGVPPEMAMRAVGGLQGLLPKTEDALEMETRLLNAQTGARQAAVSEREVALKEAEAGQGSVVNRVMREVQGAVQTRPGQIALLKHTPAQIALNLGGEDIDAKSLTRLEELLGTEQKKARDLAKAGLEKGVREEFAAAKSPEEIFQKLNEAHSHLVEHGLDLFSADLDELADKYAERKRTSLQDREKWAAGYRQMAETAASKATAIGNQILRIGGMLRGRRPAPEEIYQMQRDVENGKLDKQTFEQLKAGITSPEMKSMLQKELSSATESRVYQIQRKWEADYASANDSLPKDRSIPRSYAIATQMKDAMEGEEDPMKAPLAAYKVFKEFATKNADPELVRLVQEMDLESPGDAAKSDVIAALRAYLEDRDPGSYTESASAR